MFLKRFSVLFLMLLSPVFAAEVATFDTSKINSTELVLIMTDETLQGQVEKQYLGQVCRPRTLTNSTIREFYFSQACRAEITKFLLNNNYKPDQFFRTFVK